MPLKPCRECKQEVSSEAKSCPHCGVPSPTDTSIVLSRPLFILYVLFGVIVLVGIILISSDDDAPPSALPSITSLTSTTVLSPEIINNKVTKEKIIIDERKALQNSYFGNFRNGKIEKKSGAIQLKVWQPWINHIKRNMPQQYQSAVLSGTQGILLVDFDEIWVWEDDDDLSELEKKKYKGQLDIMTLYWKKGNVQACTLEESKYNVDPVTGANLSTYSPRIIKMYNREYILEKLRES